MYGGEASLSGGTEEEVRNKTLKLAADLGSEGGPLFWGAECVTEDADVGEMFFQCVYLRMHPSPQLAKAHEMAAAVFGIPSGNGPGKPYMPHLSLVYGRVGTFYRVILQSKHRLMTASMVQVGVWGEVVCAK